MFLDYATTTHPGRLAIRNEDAHEVVLPARLFAVADGMSRGARGGRASQLAVASLVDFYRPREGSGDRPAAPPSDPEARMKAAFGRANERVWEENAGVGALERMGTTLLAVHFPGERAVIGSVGDSRCYRVREGRIEQMTTDHLLLDVSRPHVTDAELEELKPLQAVLSRAVGRSPSVAVDVFSAAVEPGDAFLLCTSGLWEPLPDDVIREIITGERSLQSACDTLVRTANASSGRANITALLVRVGLP